jgi:hypothetical protein
MWMDRYLRENGAWRWTGIHFICFGASRKPSVTELTMFDHRGDHVKHTKVSKCLFKKYCVCWIRTPDQWDFLRIPKFSQLLPSSKLHIDWGFPMLSQGTWFANRCFAPYIYISMNDQKSSRSNKHLLNPDNMRNLKWSGYQFLYLKRLTYAEQPSKPSWLPRAPNMQNTASLRLRRARMKHQW